MKRTNTQRRYTGGWPRPDKRKFRQDEAAERQEAYSKLSTKEKLALLDARLGPGQGAQKQRAKLMAALEGKSLTSTNLEKPTTEQTTPELKHLRAKDRRKQEQKKEVSE